jgi:hypothetical protein
VVKQKTSKNPKENGNPEKNNTQNQTKPEESRKFLKAKKTKATLGRPSTDR